MNESDLNDAVRCLAVVFERRKIRHALIGGLAVGMRSRPRATKDADFILNVPALSFPELLEEWSTLASTEPERTRWLEDAMVRNVPAREFD
jgi:hypothetical protein